MNDTTVPGGTSVAVAETPTPVSADKPAPSKADVIARAKAAIEAAVADIEAAVGHELTEMRADLAAIDHAEETVWNKIEAWFKKHF